MKFKNCNQFKMPLLDLVPPPPKKKKYEHITPILKELHWLPVEERIILKNLLFVMKLHCIYLILLNFMYQAEQILDPLNPMF